MKTKPYQVWCWMGLLAAWVHAPGSQAAVRVYGLASSSGELITAQIYADISTSPIVSHSYKLLYDPRLLQVEQATRNTAVWTLFDGTRPVPYRQPDTSRRGEVWFVGAKLDARDPGAGVLGTHVLLGTAVFSRLNSLTPEFHLTIGRPGDYANFVTSHGITLDPLPGEVIFANVAPPREDQDLDGLADEWEVRFFKDPKLAFYSDDGDRDGLNNLGEQALGSDPTDGNSYLHVTIAREPKGILLRWTSFADRSFTIEASEDLQKFQAIKSGIKATPPSNAFGLPIEERRSFYRILLESAP